jgi:TATA-box binding protein (TBP) (component of TFIID and TFIIIB)
MKRITRDELVSSGPVKALGYMDADLDRVEEVFGKPTGREKTWYVEFPSGIRARVTFRLDEVHVGGTDTNALEEVANALEDGPEYTEDPATPPPGEIAGAMVVTHDPNILCRDDTFQYIVTLDALRRKHAQLPSWIRITTITMICKVFATSRIDLDKIRDAFRAQGSIRIRRKGALFSGHEWKMKETTFYNQVTVGYVDQYSTKSIKVFPNGSFQVCGCSDLYDCQRVSKQLSYLLTKVLELPEPLTSDAFRVVMINTNFSMNRPVNQMDIVDELSQNSMFEVSFNPERYSAVKIKFKPRPDMKQVTASVFSTGKVIVTGAETLREIVFAYDILNTELNKFTYNSDSFINTYNAIAVMSDVANYATMRESIIEAMVYYAPKRIEDVENLDQLVEKEGLTQDHMYELMENASKLAAVIEKRLPDSFDTVFGAKFESWVKALQQRGVQAWV